MQKYLPACCARSYGSLKRCESNRELELAGASEMIRIWCKQGLLCAEHWLRGRPEQANRLGTEIAISRTGDVENIHKEVEVPAFSPEREIFDETQIQTEEYRLA